MIRLARYTLEAALIAVCLATVLAFCVVLAAVA